MAATYSSYLALMDELLPISAPVSGDCDGEANDGRRCIRMWWNGIADAEDFTGDMNFKR